MLEPTHSHDARKAVRVRVEGRVQGVGFRAWVERQACDLALDGLVRNRRDGGVEALFCGVPANVDTMVERCHTGPTHAVVQMVKVLEEPVSSAVGFTVAATV